LLRLQTMERKKDAMTEREAIEFDVLFVGAGPASLAGAIRLMQLARERNRELEVAVLEKGAEIGSHAVSGAILNPIALQELIPEFKQEGCPIASTVRADEFYYLTPNRAFRLPFVPRYMHNAGYAIISLSKFNRWLGEQAEALGVNVFAGFTGKEVLYGEDARTVVGVRTGDQGLGADGKPKANYEPGIDLKAKVTVFGEGARGSLFKALDAQLGLSEGSMPQVYETGIKEVIQLPAENYFNKSAGNDIHTLGYPLGMNTAGGGFIYELEDNRISIGFLVTLGYENPLLDPYEEFIRFKRHPFVGDIIKNGKIIEQGARTVSTGGYYTIPKLASDGAVFVGGSAGMQNPPALKGIHVSMKSGMLAAEAVMDALEKESFTAQTLSAYQTSFEQSWAHREIFEGRNFSQALASKGLMKIIHLGAQYVTGGRGLIDRMPLEPDHSTLKRAAAGSIEVPANPGAYDGTLYVDKLTGVYLSRTKHREDEPCHLLVHDTELCVNTCWPNYRSPCTRFCPAKVYEMDLDETSGQRRLKLNPSNCLHCKTCDVKDPYENITWTCPEGGEGPGYTVV
jgi:electron-transferring-flavoprotein dehydrogenase